jgi:hypothetical protein
VGGPDIQYSGVSFESVRDALCAVYFGADLSEAEYNEAVKYVVPQQHNFENPIEPGTQDTWIQYFIDEDERLTQDYNIRDRNETMKIARISLRFLGRRAETWAKAFHHLVKRKGVPHYFAELCNGVMMEHVSPIVPMNVDYFGVGNTTVAHDMSFSIVYKEFMKFDWEPLELISVGPGEIICGGMPQEV